MQFKFQSKYAALTYPQCHADFDELYNFLLSLPNVQTVLLGREQHQDGNPHYHAALKYSRKPCIRDQRHWDFNQYHPNIQKPRDWTAWQEYCKKDGSFKTNQDSIQEEGEIYTLAKTLTEQQFFETCLKTKVPFQYAKHAWDLAHRMDRPTIPIEFEPVGTIDARLHFIQSDARRSTIIIGPSGIGKTTYAKMKSLKPSLFVTHIDDLKFMQKDIKSIIFDDMTFKHLPLQAQIHLVDRDEDRSIHVRYGTVQIPKGIQKWFTCNEEPFEEHDAINRRINKINLY